METKKEINKMCLNEKLIHIRNELQNTTIKKSGKNKFGGFDYYELKDFLPTLNLLEEKYNVNDLITVEKDSETDTREWIKLIFVDCDSDNSFQTYRLPFVIFDTPINIKTDRDTGEVREVKSMQDIQYLGALNTYYKRYLYLNALGITDGDVIDAIDPASNNSPKNKSKVNSNQDLVNKALKLIEATGTEVHLILDTYEKGSLSELTKAQLEQVIGKLSTKLQPEQIKESE